MSDPHLIMPPEYDRLVRLMDRAWNLQWGTRHHQLWSQLTVESLKRLAYRAFGDRYMITVQPPRHSLSIAPSGFVKMLKATGARRPSGSYVYEECYLQRWIMDAPPDKEVMFLDRDKLNLQRENLVLVDRANNTRVGGGRRGRFKGVHFDKKRGKWVAQITHCYQCHHLGSFDTDEEAASAYNQAAVRFHGPHAYINILPEDPR